MLEKNTLEKYGAYAKIGLSDQRAEELFQNGYGNDIEDTEGETIKDIVRKNTLTFFNMVFVVLAFLLVLAGSFNNMAFLFIAILNSLIGIVQQIRSRKALDKIKVFAEAKVKVIRSGRKKEILHHELVKGDVVELSAGNQIPADGIILSGQIQVNEALLTGEADLIAKKAGDLLMSGSFVAAGTCRARMDKVGAESYAAQLTKKAKANKHVAQTGMMKSLNQLIHVIGALLIPIGIALYYNEAVVHGNIFSEAIPSVVAALIGMIPEGLYLLTSMALAVSVMKLSRQKVLVHEMSAIETLARVDVLCVDKTGTITSQDMSVEDMICLKEEEYPRKKVENILNACYSVLDAENDTGRAMAAQFRAKRQMPVEYTIPFTSANKWTAVVFRGGSTCVIGAPEFILKERYEEVESLVLPYQQRGCRVLLAVMCDQPPQEKELCGEILPMALVVISNPIREDAPETFRYFKEQKVAVKVISGDNPSSVSRIAMQADIEGAENYVDASTLKKPEDYKEAVEKYTVFGRVTPEQKCTLIKAFQKAGHVVAMTGDGVNDVLALKQADCGIAMASGTDAACHAAQLVLLESRFSKMPKVVKEGRRVINNIQRSASLYLVKNIMSFCLSIITLVVGFPYPFVPIQLTLIGALTIGIPSFILALEPNHDLVIGKFMQNVMRRALPGGVTNVVLLVGIEVFAHAFAFERTTLSTLSTILMGTVGLLILYYISRPLDWKRGILVGGMTCTMAIAFFKFGSFFELTYLNLQESLVIVVFLLLAPSVLYFFEQMFELVSRLKKKILKN